MSMTQSMRNQKIDYLQMKQQRDYAFCKMYKGLMMAFTPSESVFFVYMEDLAKLRQMGRSTIRSKKKHMAYTNIGYRLFDQCVEKAISMGLLTRIPVDGMYDYLWDMEAYQRLLMIVNTTNSYIAMKTFCDKAFDKDRRTVMSITNDEICQLADSML